MIRNYILITALVVAKPQHNVNDYDLAGKTCSANLLSVRCPLVCAQNVTLCPTDMVPAACPQGQFYCQDGNCHSGPSQEFACADVLSACACSSSGGHSQLFPCVHNFDVQMVYKANADQQILVENCYREMKLGQSQELSLKYCTKSPPDVFSFFNTEFIVIYVIATLELILLWNYQTYKTKQKILFEKQTPDTYQKYSGIPVIENGAPSADLSFRGYKEDRFGELVRTSFWLISAFFVVFMSVLVFDYYEIFHKYAGKDTMIFVDHNNLAKVFIVYWHLMTAWFLIYHSKKTSLMTFFLAASNVEDSQYILIEKKRQNMVKATDMEQLVEWANRIEARFKQLTKSNVSKELVPICVTTSGHIYVEYECVRYVYNTKTAVFEPYYFNVGNTNREILQAGAGITDAEARRRTELSGANEILFNVNTFWAAVKQEFSGIFYIYQMMTLVIWYFYAYYYMGLLLSSIIVVSGFVKVAVSLSAQKKVIEMATFVGYNRVLRNGQWTEQPSKSLVVGDVIEIVADGSQLSADVAILSGEVVVDESSLTGEALPVSKGQVKDDDDPFSKEANAKLNILFAGTTVLEAQSAKSGGKVTALVLDTGGTTEKGKLVRDILYPVPFVFVFTEHLKIVVPILIFWGIILLFVSMWMLESANLDSWFYGMFSISQVLSPVLPAVLVIGQSVAAERLRAKGIACVDFNRITLAGKVKVFCFDKTGTLTKEGLDFFGAHDLAKDGQLVSGFDSLSDMVKLAMQTCHSLSMLQSKFVGNFVDVEMFRVTNAQIDRHSNTEITTAQGRLLRILKRFEFSHTHAYMTSVCKESASQNCFVFVKGSYEKILSMVNPSSIPTNFIDKANEYAADGFYLIAIAGRALPNELAESPSIQRSALETDLELMGLLLFRNELKPDTPMALAHLRAGGCRSVMITGDHPNTAIFIAKASGLLQKSETGVAPLVIMAELIDKTIIWQNVDTKEQLQQSEVEKAIFNSRAGGRRIELVIVGAAFKHLLEYYWLPQYIGEVRVFARMKPLDKVKCVRLHMANHITAMCGDGGNDAGALKAAHAGISLSGSGSSVVAHFSSTNLSLTCCVELLKEARCSLDVSFAAYKMLIMYGEILAVGGLIQYYFMVSMSQMMWIMIDSMTVPVSWALTMATPAKKLVPFRPTARLLGFETILSILGQIIINLSMSSLLVFILFQQDFFVCKEFDPEYVDLRKWWELADNYEGSVTGILTAFQILFAACAFNIGSRYRAGFWNNKLFLLIFSTAVSVLSFVLLADPNPLGCAFHTNCGTKAALTALGYDVKFNTYAIYFSSIGHNVLPQYFRWVVFCFAFANLMLLMAWEGIVITGPVRQWAIKFAGGRWQVKKASLRA